MKLSKGQSAYLVGIGGIGMSALAQLLKERGVTVCGSDREPSPVTKLLNGEGIDVYIGHDVQNMPEAFDVLIYSDAIPHKNTERVRAREKQIPELSYFDALGRVSKEHFTIAVAGSHGKTTTTAMLGKILQDAGVRPTVVVGSIMKDFESNFVMGGEEAPLVVEACEYQDHLLKLSPTILAVTNLEWDHTDYFHTFDQLKETFRKAVQKLPENGVLVVNLETPIGKELASYTSCQVIDYSKQSAPKLQLLGHFNEMNARAAFATARAFDKTLSEVTINRSLSEFKGTWRRFEYKGKTERGALVYDDYAHHPTEIRTTLEAVREKFPDKKVVVAFHPHLYSRTRDLMEEFASSFGAANFVILAPVYAAREEPIEGVTSEMLAEKINAQGTNAIAVPPLDGVLEKFKEHDAPDALFITMGAGDIYKVADTLFRV